MKCKLCEEERVLFIDGMCDLCYNYLNARVLRAVQESLKDVFNDKEKKQE